MKLAVLCVFTVSSHSGGTRTMDTTIPVVLLRCARNVISPVLINPCVSVTSSGSSQRSPNEPKFTKGHTWRFVGESVASLDWKCSATQA